MEIIMPYVQVKQKYQITIPASIRKKMKLHEGDTLEVKEEKGILIFTPQDVIKLSRDSVQKESPLLAMVGSNKGSGLYSSADEVDEYIDNLREEWN